MKPIIKNAIFMTFGVVLATQASAKHSTFICNSDDPSSCHAAKQDLTLLPKNISLTGQKIFIFSPKFRKWGAYNALGQQLAIGRANGGSDYCAELGRPCRTPVGVWHVYSKGDAGCISHEFPKRADGMSGGAAMPYCMFFNNGAAIHGEDYVSYRNSSHSCIRVTTQAAHWLHDNFIDVGTKVMVLPY